MPYILFCYILVDFLLYLLLFTMKMVFIFCSVAIICGAVVVVVISYLKNPV